MTDVPEISDEQMREMERRRRARRDGGRTAMEDRSVREAISKQAIDGRIRSTPKIVNKRDVVQLNVRVPIDLKDQLVVRARVLRSDVGSLVEEAITLYLARKDS